MKDLTLEVTGMKCDGCARNVEAALKEVAGVRRAEVTLDEERARLAVEDSVDEPDLVRAVDRAGYQARIAGG